MPRGAVQPVPEPLMAARQGLPPHPSCRHTPLPPLQLKWFILFPILVMAAFATAFLVLFGPDAAAGRQQREFEGMGRSLITMLSWVAGGGSWPAGCGSVQEGCIVRAGALPAACPAPPPGAAHAAAAPTCFPAHPQAIPT